MSVIVTDTGFAAADWAADLPEAEVMTLPSDTNAHEVELSPALKLVRIEFPSFADGRGFTIARVLRSRGYTGKLRASGHVISDQYAMARRCGFDDVEIDEALAQRQPEAEWKFRANWQANDYQSRLRSA